MYGAAVISAHRFPRSHTVDLLAEASAHIGGQDAQRGKSSLLRRGPKKLLDFVGDLGGGPEVEVLASGLVGFNEAVAALRVERGWRH